MAHQAFSKGELLVTQQVYRRLHEELSPTNNQGAGRGFPVALQPNVSRPPWAPHLMRKGKQVNGIYLECFPRFLQQLWHRRAIRSALEFAAIVTPKQVGESERDRRTIATIARCLLKEGVFPHDLVEGMVLRGSLCLQQQVAALQTKRLNSLLGSHVKFDYVTSIEESCCIFIPCTPG